MRLKLDENLGERTAGQFAAAGYDATTVHRQQMNGLADPELLTACHREGRCLVTVDMDFSNPLRFPPRQYSGIAVLRLPARTSRADIEVLVHTLIAGLRRGDIVGRLWVIEPGRIREHQAEP